MAVFDQAVRTREEEEGGIPEPDEVTHERLLVGVDEAGDHDEEFGEHDEEREPHDGERPGEERDEAGGAHQRNVDGLPPKLGESELRGELLADQGGQKLLDAKERDECVGEADEEYRPESDPDDVRGERGVERGVGFDASSSGSSDLHPVGDSRDQYHVDEELNPRQRQRVSVERVRRPGRTEPAEVREERRHARPARDEGQAEIEQESGRDAYHSTREGSREEVGNDPGCGAGGHRITGAAAGVAAAPVMSTVGIGQIPSTRLRWIAYSPSAIVSQDPTVRSACR